jgi:hypothetical protein
LKVSSIGMEPENRFEDCQSGHPIGDIHSNKSSTRIVGPPIGDIKMKFSTPQRKLPKKCIRKTYSTTGEKNI